MDRSASSMTTTLLGEREARSLTMLSAITLVSLGVSTGYLVVLATGATSESVQPAALIV